MWWKSANWDFQVWAGYNCRCTISFGWWNPILCSYSIYVYILCIDIAPSIMGFFWLQCIKNQGVYQWYIVCLVPYASVLKPGIFDRRNALIRALSEPLWQAGEERRAWVCLPTEKDCFPECEDYRQDGLTEKVWGSLHSKTTHTATYV